MVHQAMSAKDTSARSSASKRYWWGSLAKMLSLLFYTLSAPRISPLVLLRTNGSNIELHTLIKGTDRCIYSDKLPFRLDYSDRSMAFNGLLDYWLVVDRERRRIGLAWLSNLEDIPDGDALDQRESFSVLTLNYRGGIVAMRSFYRHSNLEGEILLHFDAQGLASMAESSDWSLSRWRRSATPNEPSRPLKEQPQLRFWKGNALQKRLAAALGYGERPFSNLAFSAEYYLPGTEQFRLREWYLCEDRHLGALAAYGENKISARWPHGTLTRSVSSGLIGLRLLQYPWVAYTQYYGGANVHGQDAGLEPKPEYLNVPGMPNSAPFVPARVVGLNMRTGQELMIGDGFWAARL